ncbi:MAG: DMT family transporter [Alphaproteobacteria bacterium]|nr:DMT family transporter [Alphaproteobacteria bacterium]MDP7428642.1 DMT family transporter [Alphaproteobacteria bacterium]
MDPLVLALVLLAAALHATWNSLVKTGSDQLLTAALMGAGSALCGLVLLPFASLPPAGAWFFIVLSVALHTGYFTTLVLSYKYGDLSHVYPLARGAAPLWVAGFSYLFAGESLSALGLAAVSLISLAIFSLARGGGGHDRRAVGYALATGFFIGSYTIADGLGARAAAEPLDYIVWLFLLNGLPLIALALWRRQGGLAPALGRTWKPGLAAGVLAFTAYGLVIWAMSMTPMTYVSTLRETSVVIAALIGTRLLGEPFGPGRLAAAAAVAAGVVLLQVSG